MFFKVVLDKIAAKLFNAQVEYEHKLVRPSVKPSMKVRDPHCVDCLSCERVRSSQWTHNPVIRTRTRSAYSTVFLELRQRILLFFHLEKLSGNGFKKADQTFPSNLILDWSLLAHRDSREGPILCSWAFFPGCVDTDTYLGASSSRNKTPGLSVGHSDKIFDCRYRTSCKRWS